MITYFKNQRDLAQELIKIIDMYWKKELIESDMEFYIKQIVQNNNGKVYKGNEFTSIIKQRLGKKRIELISKVLEKKD